MKQKEDLNKAEDTLLEIINDMDSIMKDKFVSTFEEIRQEFKKVFTKYMKENNVQIIPAYYHLDSGKVDFLK